MITVEFPAAELIGQVDAARAAIESDRAATLGILGVQILSFAQLDYATKARGGTGTDGITWAKDKRSTIEARVRSRAPAKRIVAQRKQLAAQIQAAKGVGATKKIEPLRAKRKALSQKLQQMIDAEFANYEIGVDTGLQRASAAPGFTAPDARGGNVLTVDQSGVTVGYGRSYSGYFDAARPLLPATLPPAWLTPLEEIATTRQAKIIQREFDK